MPGPTVCGRAVNLFFLLKAVDGSFNIFSRVVALLSAQMIGLAFILSKWSVARDTVVFDTSELNQVEHALQLAAKV